MAYFDREFVKTGIFSKELSHSFHRAFESRQTNDYGEIITLSEEEAKQTLEEARNFFSSIDSYIHNKFKTGDAQ